jgi:hypothetical protein
MRVLLVALFFVSTQALAQDSPMSAVRRLEAMNYEFLTYAKQASNSGRDLSNEELKDKVFEMFDSLLAGPVLIEMKRRVLRGLSRGGRLANTSEYDWAFPLPELIDRPPRLVVANDSQAVVECRGHISDTFILDEDNLDQDIESLIVAFQVNKNSAESLLKEAKESEDFVYHFQSDYLALIELRKTARGWKVVGFRELYPNCQLLSEG